MTSVQEEATRKRRDGHASSGVGTGNRPLPRIQVQSAPPIGMLWIGTFNLRWWQHIENNEKAPEQDTEEGKSDASGVNRLR